MKTTETIVRNVCTKTEFLSTLKAMDALKADGFAILFTGSYDTPEGVVHMTGGDYIDHDQTTVTVQWEHKFYTIPWGQFNVNGPEPRYAEIYFRFTV